MTLPPSINADRRPRRGQSSYRVSAKTLRAVASKSQDLCSLRQREDEAPAELNAGYTLHGSAGASPSQQKKAPPTFVDGALNRGGRSGQDGSSCREQSVESFNSPVFYRFR